MLKDRRDLLKWAVADNEGCRVSVWMDELKRDVPAIVHYKGALPPYDGIMFGVEIVVCFLGGGGGRGDTWVTSN